MLKACDEHFKTLDWNLYQFDPDNEDCSDPRSGSEADPVSASPPNILLKTLNYRKQGIRQTLEKLNSCEMFPEDILKSFHKIPGQI